MAGAGKKRLLIGSHIDTVIDAGMFDGPFGGIAGILAAGHFAKAGRKLPFGIDVLAFGDEEGSRFPATLASSTACAGIFNFASLDFADRDGITLADAIMRYGKSVADIPAAAFARDEASVFVELHIEQGPVLEHLGQPLGVVTSIGRADLSQRRTVRRGGHAGTVPLTLRRDAMTGATEVTLLAERMAREAKGEVLTTVGHLDISAKASNVVAGHVVLIVDIRSGSEPARAIRRALQGGDARDRRTAPPRTAGDDHARSSHHALRSKIVGPFCRGGDSGRRRAGAAGLRRRP